MPGSVPPVANEREGLLAFLAQQRYVLRLTAYGLTDEQVRAAPGPGSLSVGGLIKHVAKCERGWIDTVLQRDRGVSIEAAQAEYESDFRLAPGETIDDVLALYDDVAAETERVMASIADLDQPVPVPPAPWNPDDVEAWSVRWVLLHLIEETARHAGHADLVREAVDGATAFPLMAAAEGWPETPWMQPWRPPAP
jgi:uncharacterized damage-inducible protein DinB